MTTQQERIEELKRRVLDKAGVAELPASMQVPWDALPDLQALHGDSALDEIAASIRGMLSGAPDPEPAEAT